MFGICKRQDDQVSALKKDLFQGFFLCLMALFMMSPAFADDAPDQDSLIAVPATVVSDNALNSLEASIRSVYQARIDVRKTGGVHKIAVNELAQQASTDEASAKGMVARLEPYEKTYKNLLDVLGTAPAKDASSEPASITRQRQLLLRAQNDLNSRLMRARLYALEARALSEVLSQRTDAVQQALLLQSFASPVTPTFWLSVSNEFSATEQSVLTLYSEARKTIIQDVRGWRIARLLGAFAAAGCLIAAPFLLLRQVRRAAARVLPDGRLRRVTAAALFAPLCLVCASLSAGALWLGLTGGDMPDGSALASMAGMISTQIPLIGFILGAGFATLSPTNPDWRVLPISDNAAKALRWHVVWFALLIFFRGALRYFDMEAGLGQTTVQLLDAGFILLAAPLLLSIPLQIERHPAPIAEGGVVRQSMLGRVTRMLLSLVSVFSIIAMLLGYIPLGYTTLSWVCSMVITLFGLALVYLLVNDFSRTELLSAGRIGRYFVSMGMPDRIIDQMMTVLSGLFSVFLLFVAVAVAQSGGDFDFGVISGNIGKVVLGQSIGGVTLSFDVLLKCLLIPVVGHYSIKIVKRWLTKRFFPTTALDKGGQTSILTIFTYASWIGIILIVMSSIGVTVSSMTWVVSALSVGIGFGLQSIVQNFVSGIILLAERPVTIGDLVEIGGKTGDIRRISVRSTDIGLPDGSTLIVPNSQFITSAVRNATFGRPVGAMSFTIGLPLGTDLSKVIPLMDEALGTVEGLLATPAPSVTIADIQFDRVIVKISGKTASPRSVDGIANEARLVVWDALEKNGIVASQESSG
ncbi:mechanosensitive ion channel family protein [Acetobacter sp.]|jgi:small-conductance mechanosensitive channel|uniref:mechanosensitive ion channel family protein n=1 Tax=Acetobacter sp. TaxID=440 RepID=UPI0025C478C6|nr:mechanosensitive ion channel domain-containing protein [Acetobacter sp.]MCH4090684.1 mechanosensitive ion channel [Acetobacter sp.]MCI1300127.1 mechanosensitive ion channel [Acetobacter sp.]MCI1316545.1 mechanosensitive ion channel [Acetobacter sp.]